MFATRRFATRIPAVKAQAAFFHRTAPAFASKGDSIPNVDLTETSPGNKVNLFNELKGKGVIIGVPAAFSPTCSEKHVPEFIQHPKLKDAGKVFVVSVNDPFVMKAWGDSLDPTGKSGIRFLADSSGKFAGALDLLFDSAEIFGNNRSKRYALTVADGKISNVFVEPDNIGLTETSAKSVLQ